MVEIGGRRFPVVAALTLRGAGAASGAEAGPARWFAERLEDVRVAAALLQAAAEHVDLAVNTTAYIKFLPLAAQPEWVRPLIAAMEPLKRIIESCTAFEDVLAAVPPSEENASRGNTLLPGVLPDEKALETIAKAVETAEAARPYIEAADRVGPALAQAEAVRRHVAAIDRAAPLIAAVDALGPDARLASRALSAAELADLDRLSHTAIDNG